MPIYEYKCDRCGSKFESLERIDTDRSLCPSCPLGTGRRIMSAPIFKINGYAEANGYSGKKAD
jgi:putative FmdB family regulatory protein